MKTSNPQQQTIEQDNSAKNKLHFILKDVVTPKQYNLIFDEILSLTRDEVVKELENLKTLYGGFTDYTLGHRINIKAVETSRFDDRLQQLRSEESNDI